MSSPILPQISEATVGQPGWNSMTHDMLTRVNAIPEIALDALSQKLIAGAGITLSYNAVSRTLTINSTAGGGLDAEALMDHLAANIVPGTNMGLSYDDEAGTITLTSTGGAGGTGETDPEVVRDTIAAALNATGYVSVSVNDAGDTITITTTAALQTALDGKVTSVTPGLKLWKGTQVEYDAIASKDANTFYGITG